MKKTIGCLLLLLTLTVQLSAQQSRRVVENFNSNWKFMLDSINEYSKLSANVINWRTLNVPHDWSIELPFDSTSPTGTGGGALRGGMGWYSKEFILPTADSTRNISIHFDGVYCRSSVWLNGHLLGYRPNGYVSFSYPLNQFLKYGKKNIIVVKVNNNQQPNSRWYSGSGIYRKVWLQKTNKIAVADWGTFITTTPLNKTVASVSIKTTIKGTRNLAGITIKNIIYNAAGVIVNPIQKGLNNQSHLTLLDDKLSLNENEIDVQSSVTNNYQIQHPHLWSIDDPYLYRVITQVIKNKKVIDEYTTVFGIRSINFDIDKGFFLNGKHLKIRGVCNHHDLGSLGTAFNYSAAERQLTILKKMGCNGIRTSHNPPAPELLDLCDKMGFIVMDEAFDMWEKSKNKTDYHLEFVKWHRKDLEDQILRDRNHSSVFIWSVGNEVGEQWGDSSDTNAERIVTDLVGIVKNLDTTRLTVTANNEIGKWSKLLKAGQTDIIGYNYNHKAWDKVFDKWGRKPFIVTESVSALQTRGHYDMPSDSMRIWPTSWDKPLTTGNSDLTCSAYENCYTPWGSTHEQTLKVFEKQQHVSGMYVWTGFDYLGEPTPYPWPARSSYFGIIDLAGFPKDAYYLYQSVWTNQPVLHIFPHWNWQPGKVVDVWAYYNNADEVELFLNDRSLGVKKKQHDDLHVFWRIDYSPGTLKAISRKNGKVVLVKEIKTAGAAAKIILSAEKKSIRSGSEDLNFITAKIVDTNGVVVPDAADLITFSIKGDATVIATDNGNPTSLESFKAQSHKAFNGLCLAIVQPGKQAGNVTVKATIKGLAAASIDLQIR